MSEIGPAIIPDPEPVPDPKASPAKQGDPSISPAAEGTPGHLGAPSISPVDEEEIEVKSQKDPQVTEYPFVEKVLPLSTKKKEIEWFNESITDRSQRINMDGKAQNILSRMNFEVYWQFRNFQIENIQALLLERFKLQQEVDPADPNKTKLQSIDSTLNQLIDAMYEAYPWTRKFAETVGGVTTRSTTKEREEYLNKIIEFYSGVSIVIQPEDQEKKTPRQVFIQKEDPTNQQKTTLVTITENSDNTTTFKIPPEVIKGDPVQLDHAVSLMMDQATRSRERSWDLNQTISGWHNRPDIALRMYQLAILNGSIPKISGTTIEAWKQMANSNDPRAAEFKKAMELLEIFESGYNSSPPIGGPEGSFRDKIMRLNTIKDIQDHLGYTPKKTETSPKDGDPLSPPKPDVPSVKVKSQ